MIKLLALSFLQISLQLCCHAQSGTINVEVKGLDVKAGGILHVALFEKGNFPKTGKHLLGLSNDVKQATMHVSFEHVPVGHYAIAVFQDKDKNKKLNTNFIGYPTELFGFSNNAKSRFGPPSFEDAEIIVAQDQTLNLVIRLR